MEKETLLQKFKNLNVWKRGDQRAPHKPLLVLLAIGYLQSKDLRLLPYKEIDEKLKELLENFGPPRKSLHPEYPFWRLQNDGIWEVENKYLLEKRASNNDAKKSDLLKHNIHAGFKEEVYATLKENPELIDEIVSSMLTAHFSKTIHEDIIQDTCITLNAKYDPYANRDPEFRKKILTAYGHKCAVCEFDLKVESKSVGLEAAHIKWHSAGGPDRVENGISLCMLHHKLYDLGVFTFDKEFQFLLSEKADGTGGFTRWLEKYHGTKILKPIRSQYSPNPEYISWNHKEVFKKPSR